MTNAARWIALLPVIIVVAAVPFVLAARDPLEGTRQRFAAMTPAQRKSIEQSREAYDRLSSLDQYELRQLNDELAKLDPKERAELEAVMGRLQAWVATFPDAVREKYDNAMPSERAAILKAQLEAGKNDRKMILAEVRKAEEAAKRAESPPFNPQDRAANMARIFDRVEKNARTTPDERRLVELGRHPNALTPTDKWILGWALGVKLGVKAPGKAKGGRMENEGIPFYLLRQATFVPAFAKLPAELKEGLSDANRSELAKTLMLIYQLTAPSKTSSIEELSQRLKLDMPFRVGPFQLPVYLLQQLASLKDYHERKRTPPKEDEFRVKLILGKLP